MVRDIEDDDDEEGYQGELLTPKPPPPHRQEGESSEFDYILGDGNMKGAMRDNAKIGNVQTALAQIAR